VPETVTGPTKAPLFEPDIDILLHVCEFFTKKVEPKLPAVTVASVGVPISNTSPRTVPKKVSEDAGFELKEICEPVIVKADGSCTTPEIEIIQLASLPGDTAVPLTVKLNGPGVDPVNDPDMSSSI
jgi:hypothetical protein